MFESLISIVAPHQCLACGKEGSLLCMWCRQDAVPVVPRRCYGCRAQDSDSKVCASCRRRGRLSHVWIRAAYADTAHDVVYGLKFARKKQAAQLIAELLDEAVPYLGPSAIVTYVPTASSRVRLRGYDQARLIAKHFAKLRGLQMTPLLMRKGQARQLGSTKKERRAQAAASYELQPLQLKTKQILIIDDVITTGATIESISMLIKKAGARRVDAAIFAQK